MFEGLDADFLARFFLVAHVNVGGWIVPHQNHRQARCQPPAPLETFDFFFDLFLNFLGDGFAVNDPGHDLLRDEIEESIPEKKSVCKELISSLHDMANFKRQHL